MRVVTVGCPSNGRRASSISALPAPAAQTSAGGTACSLLPAAGCAAAQAAPPHPTSLLARPFLYSPTPPVIFRRWQPNQSILVLSTAWAATVVSSPAPCRSLHRPRHHPPPGALGTAWSTWSTNDIYRKWTVRGEADSWVHGRTQGNASLLRTK